MPNIGPFHIGRAQKMVEQVNDMKQDLKVAGTLIKTGYESASRQDQLAELDEWIRSPIVPVQDKIERLDSLICRNLQWGRGRTDSFWAFVFNNWRNLHACWIKWWSLVEDADLEFKVEVRYKKILLNVDGSTETVEKNEIVDSRSIAFMLFDNVRYVDVKVLKAIENKTGRRPYSNPNEDMREYKRQCEAFGREVMLEYGWKALNYIYHPDDVNPAYVLVFHGMQTDQNRRPSTAPDGMNLDDAAERFKKGNG